MNMTKGFKNIIAGILAQIITISLGILIPRLVLVNLGSEANGLLNSINNVLTYMALLEAGVGSATLQALYRPVANNDKDSINRIMAATHYFYRRTGTVYFCIVLIISIIFSIFVETSIPRIEVFMVVLLAGLSGVLSYFFQGKFKILLTAEGKKYVTTNIATFTHIGVSIGKIIALLLGGDVLTVQTVYFVFNLFQMFAYIYIMHKDYKWLNYTTCPDFDAISQRNAVLVHQFCNLVFNNTDVVILTILTNLKVVSVYSMYAMIFGLVRSISLITDGLVYALGQNFHIRERFIKMYDAFEVYTMAITSSLFCITRILIIPFLRIYTNGVHDIDYIDNYLPWLFAIYFLLHNGRQSSSCLIEIAQRYEETKWRSVLEAAINLSVSIILTINHGIYGVLLGTIAALIYRTNDVIIYAGGILERSPLITYKRWLLNLSIFTVISIVVSKIPIHMETIGDIIVGGIILSMTIIPLFILINSVIEIRVAKYAIGALKRMISLKRE